MDESVQREILKRLKELDDNFSLYLSLFKLINEDKIEEMKQELFKNKTRKKIYELCDEKKTPQDIAPEVGIHVKNVRNHLNKLTSAGLLSYEKDGRKRYYFKTLEWVFFMVDGDIEVLKEISHKLDQLIALWKLDNWESLKKFEKEIKKDKIYSKILKYADGSLSYSDLSKRVANETGAAEITVNKKISILKERKILITRRKGRYVYYDNSGLLDWGSI